MTGARSFATGCAGSASEETDQGAGAASTAAPVLARAYEGDYPGFPGVKALFRFEVDGTKVSTIEGTLTGDKLAFTSGEGSDKTTLDLKVTGKTITGTMSEPGRTSKVALTAISSPRVVIWQYTDEAIAKVEGSGLYKCEVSAKAALVVGLPDAKVEGAINAKLTIPRIATDAAGKCDVAGHSTYTQSSVYDDKGFLTVSAKSGGGAPVSSKLTTFRLADGAVIMAKEIFIAGAGKTIKALLAADIASEAGLSAEDREAKAKALDTQSFDDAVLDRMQFGISADGSGLAIDLTNDYPPAVVGLAPNYTLPWASVKPLIETGSPILPLVK